MSSRVILKGNHANVIYKEGNLATAGLLPGQLIQEVSSTVTTASPAGQSYSPVTTTNIQVQSAIGKVPALIALETIGRLITPLLPPTLLLGQPIAAFLISQPHLVLNSWLGWLQVHLQLTLATIWNLMVLVTFGNSPSPTVTKLQSRTTQVLPMVVSR